MFAIQCSKPQSIKTEAQRTTIQTLAQSGGSFRLKDSTAENIKIPQNKLKTKRLSKESVIFIQQRANAAVECFVMPSQQKCFRASLNFCIALKFYLTKRW